MQSREERLAKQKERSSIRRTKMRNYLHDIKLEKGCEVCGYNANPVALQFDHIDPSNKSFTIADLDTGWQRMIDEIEKCRVLCANCHAIHSHNQVRNTSE